MAMFTAVSEGSIGSEVKPPHVGKKAEKNVDPSSFDLSTFEGRLQMFYYKHAPQYLEHASTMYYGYRGKEKQLFRWLKKRYKVV